jgi:hypothetical protein
MRILRTINENYPRALPPQQPRGLDGNYQQRHGDDNHPDRAKDI